VRRGEGGGGDVLWAVLDVGINGLCSFLMGLEVRGTLMPSSSILTLISFPISMRALACSPTLVQENHSLRRGKKSRAEHHRKWRSGLCRCKKFKMIHLNNCPQVWPIAWKARWKGDWKTRPKLVQRCAQQENIKTVSFGVPSVALLN
jgi:hypothetical protein